MWPRMTLLCFISIHAPVKGATCRLWQRLELYQYFNPRSREGSDGDDYGHMRYSLSHFNPRSREGSDSNILIQARAL